MQVLVVEHHSRPSVGIVGETLHDLGVTIDTVWGGRGDVLPSSHRDHDAIVVLGGSMTALDDETCPYFPSLIRLLRQFAEADKPVLGICLGAQLVARAFEAELRLGGELEFGFHDVMPTSAAAEDPVLCHLDASLPLFQWHTDHYALPPDAELLATGDRYPNQCYRIGRTVYGMQFHLEVTRSMVQGWTDATPDLDEWVPGYRLWLPQQFVAHEQASNELCRAVTRRWLALA